MLFTEVRALAQGLLAQHGLRDWTIAFNRRKRTLGLCVYRRRTIGLSHHFVLRNKREEIVDTLLHEIAHALVGPGHGHDQVWKRQCMAIGAKPMRCGQAEMPEGRWQARCGQCGQDFHRYRKPQKGKGWFCRECGPERGSLVWHQKNSYKS